MAIKIIEDGPDIVLTRSEHERLLREYAQCVAYMVNPPTFEEFARSQASRAVQTFVGQLDVSKLQFIA